MLFGKEMAGVGDPQCMDALLVKLVLLCSSSYWKIICKACYSSVTLMLPPKCIMFNENGHPNTGESLLAVQVLLDTGPSTQKYSYPWGAQWELELLHNL